MGAARAEVLAVGAHIYYWTVVSALVAAAMAAVTVHSWRKKWEMDDLVTSTCRGVFVGRNEVVGTAQPTRSPLTAPLSEEPCVWFEWHLQTYVRGRNGGNWATVERRGSVAPFWVVDDTGRVLVRPRGAKVEAEVALASEVGDDYRPPFSRWELRQRCRVGEDAVERTRSLEDPDLQEPPYEQSFLKGGTIEPLGELKGRHRVIESVLRPGAAVYLLGHASRRADGLGLEFRGPEPDPPHLSTRSEDELSRSRATDSQLAAAVSLVATFAFGVLLSGSLTEAYVAAWGIAAVAVQLLALVGLTLARNHARQVTVKQQAAEAWSLIDASLRRRAELLPRLAEVADVHASHAEAERRVVAELRRDRPMPDVEDLPREATLEVAERSDRGQRAAAAGASALTEPHPELRVDGLYVDLQQRIADAEASVDAARVFYNRAIELLRHRRARVPGSLFARLVAVPTYRLFEAEELAAEPPLLSAAPALGEPEPAGG